MRQPILFAEELTLDTASVISTNRATPLHRELQVIMTSLACLRIGLTSATPRRTVCTSAEGAVITAILSFALRTADDWATFDGVSIVLTPKLSFIDALPSWIRPG